MRLYTRPALALLLAAVFCVAVVAATTFLTVSPTNLQGWQIQRSTSGTVPTPTPTPDVLFVNGPGTPPLGTGSAEFRIGPDGGGAAQLRHPGYAGTRLPDPSPTPQPPASNELSALSYSTYVQQDGSGGQAPYIILQIDTDGDAGIEDLLFFEPAYQSATFCPSNPQPALVTGAWQTWDALNGCWYSVFGTAGSGPGASTVSLRTLSAALPTGQIANSSPSGLGGVRLVTGFGAGAWDNFVGNADAFRIGVGANDTLYNFDPNQSTAAAGALLITELRFRGPAGSLDEFVEIYNNSDSAHVVAPPDGSSGYALVGSDGATLAVIPFGTTIPARAHLLAANSGGYSLSAYPASQTTTATPDLTFTANIPDGGGGAALFNTSNPAGHTAVNRLDAAGEANAPALYREGAGLAPAAGVGANAEHSYVRKMPTARPQDNDSNASDFVLISTDGATLGGVQPTLGAPGPENATSPIERTSQFTAFPLDSTQSSAAPPNRQRDFTSDPGNNSTFGTMTIRHRLVNNTGQTVTRLRYRVIIITGFPVVDGTQADLRVRSSSDTSVSNVGDGATCAASGAGAPACTVTVRGTTLETPPAQPVGGGLNSSLSVGTVTLAAPLADGASVNVQFLLGIEKTGRFRFYVSVEALSEAPGPTPAAGADSQAQSSKKLRRLFMEAQAPTPRQEAGPQPRPEQMAPSRRLHMTRPVWTVPDARPGSEKRPASRKSALTRKAEDDSEQETPKDGDGVEGRGAQKESAPKPPAYPVRP